MMEPLEPDASAAEVMHVLRRRALWFTVVADSLSGLDKNAAAVVREEAVQLRCQAAVIEALSALYDELGLQAKMWADFAQRLNRLS